MSTFNIENARALLGIVEQRRQHWSYMINALNILALTLVLGVWTFFLKGFLDYGYPEPQTAIDNNTLPFGFSYLVMAAGLSSIVLASWRWYVRYLDDHISNLYPEIMLYEQALGVPSNAGITRYLSRQKNIGNILPTLWQAQRIPFIRYLVKDRHIGRRGHTPLDIVVLISILFFIFIASVDIFILYSNGLLSELVTPNRISDIPIVASKDIGYILVIIGFAIHIFAFYRYQKNPSNRYISKIVKRLCT